MDGRERVQRRDTSRHHGSRTVKKCKLLLLVQRHVIVATVLALHTKLAVEGGNTDITGEINIGIF